MTKNTSIMMIAVIAAVMISSALAVTMTTDQAFALGVSGRGGRSSAGTTGGNGINGGNNGHAHNPCDNAVPAEHNPHCQ
jgi:hypothetical protein